MRKITEVFVPVALGAFLLAGFAAGKKPAKPAGQDKAPVLQECAIAADADEGSNNTIGVNVSSYGPLDITVAEATPLSLVMPWGATAYSGQARCLKKQGRFDLFFGATGCRPYTDEDGPPDTWNIGEICQYRLIIEEGIYARKADMVVFEFDTAKASLFDYVSYNPSADPPLQPETGTANLTIQFVESLE